MFNELVVDVTVCLWDLSSVVKFEEKSWRNWNLWFLLFDEEKWRELREGGKKDEKIIVLMY